MPKLQFSSARKSIFRLYILIVFAVITLLAYSIEKSKKQSTFVIDAFKSNQEVKILPASFLSGIWG